MLADLFKPAWKSSSVDKRLKAITEMDGGNSQEQAILTQLAAGDVNVSIRTAAIQKLTSVTALHEMSIENSNPSIAEEAEKRVNELMSVSGFVNKGECRDLLNRYPELNMRIAALAVLSSVRSDAIQSLSTQQLLEVLGTTAYTDSRQLIAEKLTNIEALESARKIVRGKDKNAERILKAKIDKIRKQQRQYAENLATVEKLIEEAEYLSSHDWMPEFKAKILVHRNNRDNLDFEMDADSDRRYQTARKNIDSRFEQISMIEQTQRSQQQLVAEVEALLQNIVGRDLISSIQSLSETLTKQDQFSSDWQQLAFKVRPNLLIHDRYDNMLNALQSATQLVLQATAILQDESVTDFDESEVFMQTGVAEKLAEKSQKLSTALTKLRWPAAYGELKVATELTAQLTDWHEIQKRSVAERRQKLDLLHKKISSIFHFSRIGNLARAKQLCEKVEKGLKLFEGKDRQALQERFEEAQKTLGKMGDWKNFATEPKYLELCEAMELLGSSRQHPDKISKQMKDLQQQWKTLGHSDVSDQYWSRFKEAADKVYKPCAEFFDKRHRTRKAHLQQRQQYVDQMRELFEKTDWDNDPDYKVAQSAVRSISDHFVSIKDVEHNVGQKQWKQFSKFKDAVFSKLDIAYEANISLKQQLIKQTEALAEADAKVENLAKLKTLQTRWKQIGITKRNQDQKAWSEFKKQGDIIYSKVQQLRQGQRDETDQQLNAFREIIRDIKKLARTAKDLAEADKQFTVLQEKYADLPELPVALPEKLIEGIQRDYRNACDQFDSCHLRIIDSMHTRQIDALRLKANLCSQLEVLGESPAEQQLQEISQQWDSIDLHDSALSRRIEARRNSAQQAIDRVAIGAERRLLCIQLEIAMDAESPAEDKVLRMQYQLEQMNKSGLGRQTVNSSEQLESMELDWLCMPGAEPKQQKELDERFQRALRSK